MTPDPIYHLTGPTAFSAPPGAFSYSSLGSIERCPRQWQLAHARYGDRDGFPARPSPAAAEGEIVHDALDHLFRRLSFFGLPPAGTADFRAAIADADVTGFVGVKVREHEARLRQHPRGAGARLAATEQQLVNRVIRLFREVYPNASARPPFTARGNVTRPGGYLPAGSALVDLVARKGALGELPLAHPAVPFRGVLDLVWWDADGPVVTDFKTGSARPEHRTQVGYYSVLWWRCAGLPPVRAEVRYPGSVATEVIGHARLGEYEAELIARIEAAGTAVTGTPAPAKPGECCRYCDVRQFCESYWAGLPGDAGTQAGATDLELVVAGEPTATGFVGTTSAGDQISVVFHADVGRAHGPFRAGDRLRIINAVSAPPRRSFELRAWSEVFRS